jgi:hypothetical protein
MFTGVNPAWGWCVRVRFFRTPPLAATQQRYSALPKIAEKHTQPHESAHRMSGQTSWLFTRPLTRARLTRLLEGRVLQTAEKRRVGDVAATLRRYNISLFSFAVQGCA